MKSQILAAASGIALAALLAAPAQAQGSYPAGNGERVDANGMPTTRSTPAEQAATADLNNQVAASDGITKNSDQNAANNAQYQAQQQQYQQALSDNQAQQQDYQNKLARYHDQSARYGALRERYAAERAAYHRGIWPDRYVDWVLVDRDDHLVGERVELITGARVGTVTDIALKPNGRVAALLVQLDGGKVVWIDQADIRYNRADGIVMTNLDRGDLRHMADERL